MNLRTYLLISLGWWPLFVCGQVSTLSGTVMEDSSRQGVEFVQIFIPELNKSAVTDENGQYNIAGLPQGKWHIQFSAVGYATQSFAVTLKNETENMNIFLTASEIEASEVVIYGDRVSTQQETPNNIISLDQLALRQSGAFSISDGMARLPGVSQLSTGNGISKPVIRGLFGNRIQTVMLGLRFDNQQWQDEHGLGLSDVGIDRVDILKGPVSLLYGSEAMGGVLQIIEEKPAPVGTVKSDASLKFFSNTLGGGIDAGVKGAREKMNWRVRLGGESHADYTDANNNRVFNTRFDGYFGKASVGFNRKKWVSQNHYMFSLSDFGFTLEGIISFPVDERYSRSFDLPHHTVIMNVLSSQNTFFLGKTRLKVNVGAHNNNRQEQEGGNMISLDMMLNTYSGNAIWYVPLHEKWEISLGTQDMLQTNRNFGARTIVPDANIFESSVFAYVKGAPAPWVVLEGGIRYDIRNLETFTTGTINTADDNPGKDVLPFSRQYGALNGSFGTSINPFRHFNLKANFSSGYRSGNLAELSSNGLHEGTYRYEIGNTELGIEQNFCEDIQLSYRNDHFSFSASAYNNRFENYIYLAPTQTEYLGLSIYRYIQENATLQGAEFSFDWNPSFLHWIDINGNYSMIEGKTDFGEYLPFIPANKIYGELKFIAEKTGKKFSESYIKAGISYVLDQNKPAQFETSTPAYYVLNAGVGTSVRFKKQSMLVSVICNNLLNELYYDHLSRFKYFGLYNIGRNIALNLKFNFN